MLPTNKEIIILSLLVGRALHRDLGEAEPLMKVTVVLRRVPSVRSVACVHVSARVCWEGSECEERGCRAVQTCKAGWSFKTLPHSF